MAGKSASNITSDVHRRKFLRVVLSHFNLFSLQLLRLLDQEDNSQLYKVITVLESSMAESYHTEILWEVSAGWTQYQNGTRTVAADAQRHIKIIFR